VTLQRSLLPRDLPMGPGYRAAARYLAGARGTRSGGDWYDVVEVGDALCSSSATSSAAGCRPRP
jgi:serine phosphatase RsbU (regulator of sigma subunit)